MRYVEPSRRRLARAASVRRSGKQKRSGLFQFGSQPAAKPNARYRKTLENQRKQTAETPTGVPPNGLVAGTAGELSPRCGGFKSFRGGGRKALRPTVKERRKAVRRWRSHAKRRKTRQVWPDARSVERSERTQGIHFAQPAEHRMQGPAAEIPATAGCDPRFRQGLAGMDRGHRRFGILE